MDYEQFKVLAAQNNVIIDLLAQIAVGAHLAGIQNYRDRIEDFNRRVEWLDPENARQE